MTAAPDRSHAKRARFDPSARWSRPIREHGYNHGEVKGGGALAESRPKFRGNGIGRRYFGIARSLASNSGFATHPGFPTASVIAPAAAFTTSSKPEKEVDLPRPPSSQSCARGWGAGSDATRA